MSPPPDNNVAADIEAIRQTLAGIGLDDASQGAAADAVRRALAQHSVSLDMIGDAARAVAEAARDHEALVAERDAQMPSDTEIRDAQEAVITTAAAAADGSGSPTAVRDATNHLSDLLARKKAAQAQFDRGQQHSAAALEHATRDLPGDPPGSGPGGAGAFGAVLSTLARLKPPTGLAAAMPPAAGTDPFDAPGSDDSGSFDPAALLASDDEPDLGGPGTGALTGPDWAQGAGQTHTSADELPQIPTIAGAQTVADVSGRPANPFTVTPAPTAGPAPGIGAGGMPMMPPMAPFAGNGVASGKAKGNKSIINTDPDFTGADIDVEIATSGVVGHGDNRR